MIIDVILRYPIVLSCLLSFFVVYLNSREYAYVMDTATYRFTAVIILCFFTLSCYECIRYRRCLFLVYLFFVLLLHSV